MNELFINYDQVEATLSSYVETVECLTAQSVASVGNDVPALIHDDSTTITLSQLSYSLYY